MLDNPYIYGIHNRGSEQLLNGMSEWETFKSTNTLKRILTNAI